MIKDIEILPFVTQADGTRKYFPINDTENLVCAQLDTDYEVEIRWSYAAKELQPEHTHCKVKLAIDNNTVQYAKLLTLSMDEPFCYVTFRGHRENKECTSLSKFRFQEAGEGFAHNTGTMKCTIQLGIEEETKDQSSKWTNADLFVSGAGSSSASTSSAATLCTGKGETFTKPSSAICKKRKFVQKDDTVYRGRVRYGL